MMALFGDDRLFLSRKAHSTVAISDLNRLLFSSSHVKKLQREMPYAR